MTSFAKVAALAKFVRSRKAVIHNAKARLNRVEQEMNSLQRRLEALILNHPDPVKLLKVWKQQLPALEDMMMKTAPSMSMDVSMLEKRMRVNGALIDAIEATHWGDAGEDGEKTVSHDLPKG